MTIIEDRPSAHRAIDAERDPSRRTEQWRELRRRAKPRPRSTRQGLAAAITLTVTALFVWVIFYALVLTPFVQNHDQAVLYSKFREQLALATAPLGGTIAPGEPVGLISMPSAGMDGQVVVEGTTSRQLVSGPGHRRDTPLPGEAGVSLLYGRSTLFGAPFDRIARASEGDVITVVTGLGTSKYVVEDVRRAGDPFPPALTADGGRLTLVTSEGSGWLAGWAPDRTVFVDAKLVSKPVVGATGRPSAVPHDETAMQSDTGSLFTLVLLLPLLIVAVTAAIWAQSRWGRWQAWILGFPLVLAGLWACSQSAAQLLPNLV